MRLTGNYYSEWADAGGDTRRTLLVTLVACAVGATASAAVIFSLASSPTTQSGVPSIAPRAIVRNVGAPELPKTVQDEVPKAVQNEPVKPTSQRAANSMVSARDEPVTQTEAEHRAGGIASNREGIAEFAIPIGDDLRTILGRNLSALGETDLPIHRPTASSATR
jgi:hypothetical protein